MLNKFFIILLFFIISCYSFPLFSDPGDTTEILPSVTCASNPQTFSNVVPFYGAGTNSMLMNVAGRIHTLTCIDTDGTYDTYVLPNPNSGTLIYSNVLTGASQIDGFVGDSFTAVEWVRYTWSNIETTLPITSNEFQLITATDFTNTFSCFIYPNDNESGAASGGLETENSIVGFTSTSVTNFRLPESGNPSSASLDGIENGSPAANSVGLAEGLYCFKVDSDPPCKIDYECPADFSIDVDSTCSANLNLILTSSCNTDTIPTTVAPSTTNPGVTTYTLTPTNLIGFNDVVTCTTTVTINDNIDPVITCPNNYPLTVDSNCEAFQTTQATATDNCDANPTITYNPPFADPLPPGNHLIEATATDNSGNTHTCDFTVTVTDSILPTIQCPANIILNTLPPNCVNTVPTPTPRVLSDNCPGVTFTQIPTSGTLTQGTHSIEQTAMDTSGNIQACNFEVLVQDIEGPQFQLCPSIVLAFNTDPGRCTTEVDISPETQTVTDNCGVVTSIRVNYPIIGYNFPLGLTNVVAIATDTNDISTSCSFNINVMDNQPPVVICPDNISLQTYDQSTVVFFAQPTITDNCQASLQITSTSNSGDTFPIGTTDISYFAFDGVFNITCSFQISIELLLPSDSPTQTIINLPSSSPTNIPTPDEPSAQASRDQVSASLSNSRTRSLNPSITSSISESLSSTPDSSQSPSPFPSSSESPSSSNTNTATSSISLSSIPTISESKSVYIPSNSPSLTPSITPIVFIQDGVNTLVEIIISCSGTNCIEEQTQIIIDEIALLLDIPNDNIFIISTFSDEVTIIICDSNNVADLLNNINQGDINSLSNITIEDATFNVACPNNNVVYNDETSNNSKILSTSLMINIIFSIIIILFI